jgi:hypothetical protein
MDFGIAQGRLLGRHATLTSFDDAFSDRGFCSTVLPCIVNDIREACSRFSGDALSGGIDVT